MPGDGLFIKAKDQCETANHWGAIASSRVYNVGLLTAVEG